MGTRLLVVIEGEGLDSAVGAAFEKAARGLGAPVSEALARPLGELAGRVEEARARVAGLLEAQGDDQTLAEALREAAEALRRDVDARLGALDERVAHAPLTAPVEALRQALAARVAALPQAIEVAAEAVELPEEGLAPPRGVEATEPLAVQAVARAVLVDGAAGRLVEIRDRIDELTAAAREALGHARSLERFHLSAAADELATAGEREGARGEAHAAAVALAREFAEGGLARLGERLSEEELELQEGSAEAARRLAETGAEARARLRELLTRATPAEARAATREALATPSATGRRERARAWLATRVQPLLPSGAGEEAAAGALAGADQASVAALAGHVPPAYLRLFTTNPLGVDEFHVGRERELETLTRAVERFRGGRASAVLVLAPPGGGARSFVERGLRGPLRDLTPIRVVLGKRVTTARALVGAIGGALGHGRMTSPRRLMEHLRALPERSVLTLGPLGRAHLRTPDGLEALRLLRKLVGETGHQVLWLVVSDEVTVRALEAAVPLREAFTHVLPLSALGLEEVQALVERRHRASGYRLRFEGARHGTGGGLGKGLVGAGSEREGVFEALWERSQGVPLRVVFEWLRTVEHVGAQDDESGARDDQIGARDGHIGARDDQIGARDGHIVARDGHIVARDDQIGARDDEIVARPVRPLALGFLDGLGLDELVLVAQLHIHAGLTTEEAARVMRVGEGDADAALRGLAWRSVVQRSPVGVYELNPLLWGALRQRLRDRGIA